MTKIALIEFGDFHDECLYSQIQFLQQDDIEIILFVNAKLKSRIEDFSSLCNIVYLDLSSKTKKYRSLFKVYHNIIFGGFSKIIFNTAESNIYKFIQFLFPKRIELIGTLHNGQNLKLKSKQKIISKKLSKYFVLNDFVAQSISEEKLTTNKLTSYYPIFFPNFETSLQKPKNEIWIIVPGVISFDKRDYSVFKDLKLEENFKIIFLGRANNPDAKAFIDKAKSYPSFKNLFFFEDFIPNNLFHNYIKHSDYILPLIHPNNEFFNYFLKYKISGSYNLAFGYKKTLLMEQSFSEIEDFKEIAFFYDANHFERIFDIIKNSEKKVYQNPKWNFEFQKKNYLDYIFS
jgi:hypothetical protein